MSPIFISRDREQLGEFSEEQVVHGLMNGRFFPSDLAWREGMEEWRPLAELQLVEKAASQPPPTALGSPAELTSLSQSPSPLGIEWEAQSGGIAQRWWDTTVGIIFSPIQTFSKMKVTGGYGPPLLYYFVSAILTAIVFGVLQIAASLILPATGLATAEETLPMAGGLLCAIPLILAFSLVGAAIGVVLGAFLGGGIAHLCLMLLGANNRGFEATLRGICYSYGAIQAMCIVPVLGWIAAPTWGTVVYVIALKEAHQTDYWRVIIAVLLPLVLCCGVGIFAAFALGGLSAL